MIEHGELPLPRRAGPEVSATKTRAGTKAATCLALTWQSSCAAGQRRQ